MKGQKVILLLDDASKLILKTSITSLTAQEVFLIISLTEITESMLAETTNLVVLEGFVSKNGALAELRLYKTVYGLNCYYLGSNKFWLDQMASMASCFSCDISLLDYSMIQAALFSDKTAEAETVAATDEVELCAERIVKGEEYSSSEVVCVADSYLTMLNVMKDLTASNSLMKERVHSMDNELKRLEDLNRMMLSDYRNVLKSSVELNRSLTQYELSITRNIYQQVNLASFSNRPSIIYLKEYEELPQLDLLIQTLFDALRIQYQKSVKVLRLYDNSGNRKVCVLPEYYKVIYSRYTQSDVLANDFICKTGDYVSVLDMLLTNRTNCDVLIVVDHKDHNDIVLDGSPFQINLCRDKEHAVKMGLLADSTVLFGDYSDNDDYENVGYMYWGPYSIDGLGKDESFIFLSSRSVVQRLLSTFTRFEQSL